MKKKKTSTERNTLNPSWNEALVFSVGKEALKHSTLEFIIFNDNLLGNNEVLGTLVLGPDSRREEKAVWNDMVNAKNATARWHRCTPP